MKFDTFFMIRGPGGTKEVPNNTNPVECANLTSLLNKVKDNLPNNFAGVPLETIGIRVIKKND